MSYLHVGIADILFDYEENAPHSVITQSIDKKYINN